MNYTNFNQYDLNNYDMYQDTKKQTESYKQTALRGYYQCKTDDNPLADMFFSGENVRRIQKKIKKEILEKTNGSFKLEVDQDDSDLVLAMRNIFLENSRFLPIKIVHQIKKLNQQVVDSIVPDMISQIKQEYGYIKEINEPLKPMMRPMNVSGAGRKTLPAITSIWGL